MELRKRTDVIIATPGRLIDHLQNSPSFGLDTIEILVLDEADRFLFFFFFFFFWLDKNFIDSSIHLRMLEEGFHDALTEIIRNCPKGRQTMLFSASMTDQVYILFNLNLIMINIIIIKLKLKFRLMILLDFLFINLFVFSLIKHMNLLQI